MSMCVTLYTSQHCHARLFAQGMCACIGNVVKDTSLSPSISTAALSIVHVAFAKKRYRSALLPRPMFVAGVEGVIESLPGQQVAQLIAVATWARIIHCLHKIGPMDPEYPTLPARTSRASHKLFSLLHAGMAVGSVSSWVFHQMICCDACKGRRLQQGFALAAIMTNAKSSLPSLMYCAPSSEQFDWLHAARHFCLHKHVNT